jgi:hypothetical protein
MNTIKHVLLKGNESFLDHTKSIALYGKLYWRKSNKKLNVGDIVYLFMSGKGHYQIRYKLEVTNTSVTRQDEKCWYSYRGGRSFWISNRHTPSSWSEI